MNNNKKGQLEIFGLAIIMVLFMLGLLLFIKFSDEKQEIAEDFLFKQLPTKILNTMKDTTTDCKNQRVEILINDVASHLTYSDTYPQKCAYAENAYDQIQCTSYTNSYYELFNPIDGAITQILKNSLEESKINYEFEIRMRDGCLINKTTYNFEPDVTGCERARKVYADTFIFTSDKGAVEIILKVC